MTLLAYNSYMKEVIIEIAKKANPSIEINEVIDGIRRVIRATVFVTKTVYRLVDVAENSSKAEDRDGNLSDLIYIKISELQKTVDDEIVGEEHSEVFKRYLSLLLRDVPEVEFDFDKEIILTSNPDIQYLKSCIKFIYELNSMQIEAFLW